MSLILRYPKILRRISFGNGKLSNSVFKIDVTEGIVAGLITPAHSTFFDYVINSKYFQKMAHELPKLSHTSDEFITYTFLSRILPKFPLKLLGFV